MIRLGDLQAFCPAPLKGAFATAAPLDARALKKAKGPALVISADVAPHPAADSFVLENDLANCGKAILLPTISEVSGTFIERGLTYIPKGHALDTTAELILPLAAGRFLGNATPEQAFRTAHTIWQNTAPPRDADARNRMALALSLGSDAPNGEWWVIGGLAGLLDIPREPELTALLDDPTDILPSRRKLTAQVRQRAGLPVQVLDMQQSAIMKAMLTDLAPANYWHALETSCVAMGLGETAARYKTAAERIWG